jgi:hypothetical protein
MKIKVWARSNTRKLKLFYPPNELKKIFEHAFFIKFKNFFLVAKFLPILETSLMKQKNYYI